MNIIGYGQLELWNFYSLTSDNFCDHDIDHVVCINCELNI